MRLVLGMKIRSSSDEGGIRALTIHFLSGAIMLRWALVFLVVAIIAAVFGFGGLAGTAAAIAQVLFYVFLGVFLLMLIAGLMRGSRFQP